MIRTIGTRLTSGLWLVALSGLGCQRDNANQPGAAIVDTTNIDSGLRGTAGSTEDPFLQWWRQHARRVALGLREPESAAPVNDLARYALAGADTTVVGAPETVEILDLERQNATLPNTKGAYQVYAFPDWERQLKLWVPEDSKECARQMAALVIGGGEPTFFPLNPLCQAANVPYDVDGIAITAYYPRADGAPWIEFVYNTTPCATLHLFRWASDRERLEPVRAVRSCEEAR
jgi:hypothetical protein